MYRYCLSIVLQSIISLSLLEYIYEKVYKKYIYVNSAQSSYLEIITWLLYVLIARYLRISMQSICCARCDKKSSWPDMLP